jgi:flagellar biosynthetic protein FliO
VDKSKRTSFIAALLAAGPLGAAEKPVDYLSEELGQLGTTAPAAPQAPSLLPALFDVAFSLAFVVGLVYLAYWLLLKWRDRQGLGAGSERVGLIKVLERQSLDARHGIAVVEVGDKVLTLGLGDHISLLDSVDDPEQVERLKQMAPLPASIMGFREQLQRVGLRLKKEEWGQAKQALKAQSEELDEQMERLKKSRRGGER